MTDKQEIGEPARCHVRAVMALWVGSSVPLGAAVFIEVLRVSLLFEMNKRGIKYFLSHIQRIKLGIRLL